MSARPCHRQSLAIRGENFEPSPVCLDNPGPCYCHSIDLSPAQTKQINNRFISWKIVNFRPQISELTPCRYNCSCRFPVRLLSVRAANHSASLLGGHVHAVPCLWIASGSGTARFSLSPRKGHVTLHQLLLPLQLQLQPQATVGK